MTAAEFRMLPLGLYRVFWRSGGSSLAAIGMGSDGARWLAPCNWVSPVMSYTPGDGWMSIERVEILFSVQELRSWEEQGR